MRSDNRGHSPHFRGPPPIGNLPSGQDRPRHTKTASSMAARRPLLVGNVKLNALCSEMNMCVCVASYMAMCRKWSCRETSQHAGQLEILTKRNTQSPNGCALSMWKQDCSGLKAMAGYVFLIGPTNWRSFWLPRKTAQKGTINSKKRRRHVAMGQKPVPQLNIPFPTKIGSKLGGEFTYPKMGSHWF